MNKVLKEVLFWTWCLPQTLLGFILKLIYKGKKRGNVYIYENKNGSISLLLFRYMKKNSKAFLD